MARGKSSKDPAERLVETLARQHTSLAIEVLADICGDAGQPAPARVTAASALLDRGWGKPKQDFSVEGGDLSGLSDADILAELAAIDAEKAGIEGGTPPPPTPRIIN